MTTKQTIKYLKKWHNKNKPKRKDFKTCRSYHASAEYWMIEKFFLDDIEEELIAVNKTI